MLTYLFIYESITSDSPKHIRFFSKVYKNSFTYVLNDLKEIANS